MSFTKVKWSKFTLSAMSRARTSARSDFWSWVLSTIWQSLNSCQLHNIATAMSPLRLDLEKVDEECHIQQGLMGRTQRTSAQKWLWKSPFQLARYIKWLEGHYRALHTSHNARMPMIQDSSLWVYSVVSYLNIGIPGLFSLIRFIL